MELKNMYNNVEKFILAGVILCIGSLFFLMDQSKDIEHEPALSLKDAGGAQVISTDATKSMEATEPNIVDVKQLKRRYLQLYGSYPSGKLAKNRELLEDKIREMDELPANEPTVAELRQRYLDLNGSKPRGRGASSHAWLKRRVREMEEEQMKDSEESILELEADVSNDDAEDEEDVADLFW